jgi:tetratricopeptide (TPR) repeat protein
MTKKIFFLAIMIALVTVCAFGQNARKYYKAGTEFVESMKYEDAIVQFTSAIGMEPMNPEYYYSRGQVYEDLSRMPEAKADYEKTLVFSPKDVDAIISLGVVTNKMGDHKESLRLLNRALSLDVRNPRIQPARVITLIDLGMYDQALTASDSAIVIKDTPMDFYYRGIIYKNLHNEALAKKELEKAISKDKKLAEPRLELAELLISSDPQEAMKQCNEVLKYNDRNTDAYLVRSKVYKKNLDYPNAINDISKNILIDPANPGFYLIRGDCYQEFNQHTNAINDYSKYISLNDKNPKAYYARAKSYEEIVSYEKAIEDYAKITVLTKYDPLAKEYLDGANGRLYELNREKVAPDIAIISPAPVNSTLEIRGDKTVLSVNGKIRDKSKIKAFSINNKEVTISDRNGEYEFLTEIDVTGVNSLTFVARDDYNNEKVLNYSISRTEITPPQIRILAPYTSESGQVSLESSVPNVAIQGKIADVSKIKSITIGNITASYDPNELNPSFSAILNVANINKFTVAVEDIHGNRQETEYTLNREGAGIAATNPMGKTWVLFIENSSYETFGALDGPRNDINTIRRALANYQINNIIQKKDMTKREMELYFNIELRDLIRSNQVKSLMIWYAGHGKYINDVGYWIPVDAKRDEEFTYFNINFLKAGLMGYENDIVHTLVISDACESGPGFYAAMRVGYAEPTCNDKLAAGLKSAQVFSSAGYQLASDNSKFAATFASTLISNINSKNACIPIQTIVKVVTEAVKTEKGQVPKFGTIQGLTDMHGTFFFIAK